MDIGTEQSSKQLKNDIKDDITELESRYKSSADAGERKELAYLIQKKQQKLEDVEFEERLDSKEKGQKKNEMES